MLNSTGKQCFKVDVLIYVEMVSACKCLILTESVKKNQNICKNADQLSAF